MVVNTFRDPRSIKINVNQTCVWYYSEFSMRGLYFIQHILYIIRKMRPRAFQRYLTCLYLVYLYMYRDIICQVSMHQKIEWYLYYTLALVVLGFPGYYQFRFNAAHIMIILEIIVYRFYLILLSVVLGLLFSVSMIIYSSLNSPCFAWHINGKSGLSKMV